MDKNPLNAKFESLSAALDSSQTAQPGKQAPSMKDISTEQQLQKTRTAIANAQDKALRERWYSTDEKDDKSEHTQKPTGLLQSVLNGLQTPLYGLVGAVDHLKGNGRGENIIESMNANATNDKRTFGDVTGNGALGLTLDIMLDPVNIATAGTSALIPRIFIGAGKGASKAGVKGALKGAAAGAESRALESTLMARNLTLGGTKLALNIVNAANPMRWFGKVDNTISPAAKSAMQTGKAKNFLEKRLQTSTKTFDEIVGKDAIQRSIEDKTFTGLYSKGLESMFRKVGESNPVVKEYFDKYFKYSSRDWTRIARIQDALLKHSTNDEAKAAAKAFVKTYDEGGDMLAARQAAQESVDKFKVELQEAGTIKSSPFEDPSGAINMSKEELNKATSALSHTASPENLVLFNSIAENADEVTKMATNPQAYVTSDPFENSLRLAAEAELIDMGNYSALAEDLRKVIKSGELGDSGIQWWDNLRAKTTNFKEAINKKVKDGEDVTIKERVGQKAAQTLDVYEGLIAAFKRGAVGASPRAWTNAVFGNLVMAKMAGFDVIDPRYADSLMKAHKMIGAKKGSELLLNELMDSGDMLNVMRNNPTLFENTTGLSRVEVEQVEKARQLVQRFKQVGADTGVVARDASNADVIDMMEDVIREAGDTVKATESSMTTAAEGLETLSRKKITGPSKRTRESIDEFGKVNEVKGTDIVANEFYDSESANKIFKRMSEAAEKEDAGIGVKLADYMFNKMPDAYGGIDYRYKLGAVHYATTVGVKESELRQFARLVDLSPDDVTPVVTDGIPRYQISGAKAFEIANEAFLNYSAMPAIVKMLRHLPLVGAPFVSFTYGMYGKTLKTLVNNPAFFNKSSFALQEFSDDPSPIEKGLLSMQRYQYLNDPAMVKLPFPGNQMVYANAANVLPYLSLSMLQPTDRAYKETLPNNVVQTIDRLPIMKDPIGSLLFDYLLMPSLLNDELPLGSFGQPLYPKDASIAEKVFYGARSAADPFVPGVAQMGLGIATPQAGAQFLPGYLSRKLSEAKEGNTPLGIQSKEPAVSRFFRGVGSGLGVPIQTPVPHEYLDTDEIQGKLSQ